MSKTGFRSTVAAVLVLVLLALAGCHDHFRGWDMMGFQAKPKQLRQIEQLDLSAMHPDDHHPPSQPAEPPAETTLTLQQCRALALEFNLSLKVQLLGPTIAAQTVTEAEAQFESLLAAEVTYSSTDMPVLPNSNAGINTKTFDIGPRLTIPLRTGGQLSLAVPSTRTQTDPSGSIHTSDLRFSFSQPLLRRGGWRANTHPIRVARLNQQQSEALAKLEIITVLAAVDRVYWLLYASREELAVRKQEHELAKEQLARARRQVNAGSKPEVEILRAELGVAESLEKIILADNAVSNRQRDLKRLLQKPGLEMQTPTMIIPATPPSIDRYDLDACRLVQLAMENRMELLELQLQLAIEASTIDLRRNQKLPLLALGYTYNVNGLGDTHGDAVEMMHDKRFEGHFLGLQLEIPLGNQAARSRLRAALAQRIQTLARRDRRQAVIAQEVYNTVDQLTATWQRIQAAEQRVIHAERVARAEQRQFDQGLRTSTEVRQAQASLADAQSSKLRALVEYQIAQIDLAVASGTLLGADRIRREPVVPAEVTQE